MEALYFLLVLAAFICFGVTAVVVEPKLAKLVPTGLALWVLVSVIQRWPW